MIVYLQQPISHRKRPKNS